MTASVDSSDTLLDELRGELGDLATKIVDEDTYDWPGKVPDPAERAEKRTEVLRQVTANADEILQNTNQEIVVLRGAIKRLDDHKKRPGEPDDLDRAGHVMVALVFWLGGIVPLLFWQLGRFPISGGTVFGLRVALVVTAFACLRWSNRLVARAGVRFTGRRTQGGAGWWLNACLATTYLVLLWRLWSPSQAAMGVALAVVVWAVGALVTFVLFFGVHGAANAPVKDREPDPELPAEVIRRTIFASLVGLTAIATDFAAPLPPWARYLISDVGSLLCFVVVGQIMISGEKNPRLIAEGGWEWQKSELRKQVAVARFQWRGKARLETEDLVTQAFNRVVEPTFSTTLEGIDPRSLGQMHDGERAVTSLAAGDRLRSLLAGLLGGAVGVAGPRGAGKSTLLTAFRQGKFGTGTRSHIAVLESVPVRYDAREFVLHLFTRTSQAVIEFCTKRGAGRDNPRRSVARSELLRRAWPIGAVLVGWLIVGLLGSLLVRGVRYDPAAWFAAGWWPLVGVLAAASALYLIARRRPATGPAHQESPPQAPPGDLSALRDRARWELDRIRYQQKRVAGWSGKVGVQIGAEATVTGSREVTRQPLSYPEIVHEFSEFLRTTIGCVTAYPDIEPLALVIILDELDKIVEPEAAQDFLNEIKALFSLDVRGFLFLVSVSEDALAAFERRGLPVRDAFDSAFDMIFRLDYLKLDDSRKVLSRRVVGIPDPFVCLCHCLAGGLPRELIRVGRQVIAGPASLATTARDVVAEDLASKQAGLRTVAARGNHDEIAVGDLVRHVDAHAVADPVVLLDAVSNPPVPSSSDPSLRRLQVETLGYLYYLATVLEFFGPGLTETDWRRGTVEGDGSFDTLASVRQLFPVNARLAWLTTNAFRQAWNLAEVPPPHGEATR